MTIPVYVVTGFLYAGKTTFLNAMLNRYDRSKIKTLLLQFESGEEEFQGTNDYCICKCFSKKELEGPPDQMIREIYRCVKEQAPDEIWIEWNGVTPFSLLQDFFQSTLLRSLRIQKVIHFADVSGLEEILGRTGTSLPEQIANSDAVILRISQKNSGTGTYQRMRHMIKNINPGVPVFKLKETCPVNLYKWVMEKKPSPVYSFFRSLLFLTAAYFLTKPVLDQLSFSANTIINVFLGIILQAIPFLLLGVLLSSIIQIFVPRSWIEKHFPKSLAGGMLAAVAGGFCLPVCDCASIPIFRSLVRKGVPLPAAVTFMLAAPVINPVAILSTYYAFGGNLAVVAGRIGMGGFAAVAIGLSFTVFHTHKQDLPNGRFDGVMCSCGCYQGISSISVPRAKIEFFLRHAQAEFFDVGKYLILGSFVTSVFQGLGTGMLVISQGKAGDAVSTIIMMVMAFVLSLCSSSDAIVARSFSAQFPMMAIMGFLIFGPMMDIKNLLMLSSGFSKRFIIRLLFTSFLICFAVVFLFYQIGGI